MDKEYELNAYLAELINKNVTIITGFRSGNGVFIEEKYGMVRDKYAEWTPLNKLYQAFEVLEEYCEGYDLNHSNEYYTIEIYGQFVNIFAGRKILSDHSALTKPKAIIGAICKAEGIYEEFEEVFNNDQT